jgi:hypothetical protein
MMPRKKLRICESEFRRLWTTGWSRTQLAEHFNCSVSGIDTCRMNLALPARLRKKPRESHCALDPTPEEIEQRKKEAREIHLARRRSESERATEKRLARRRVLQES